MKSLVFVLSAMLLAACTHPEQVKNPASEGPVISAELSNQKVTCVCEDAQGQIWIGTFRGLNRYNSHEYHQYFCHDDSVSLPDNQIQDLMLDSKGRLWVSTVNGVARYTDQDQFEQIPIEGPNGNGVQLLELKNGRILLNMVVHLQAYNPETNAFEMVYPWFDPNQSYAGLCHVDAEGNLWDVKSQAVRRFEPDRLQLCDSIPLTNQSHICSFLDQEGIIWIGGDGLITCIDTKTRQIIAPPSCIEQSKALKESSIINIRNYGTKGLIINTDKYGLFYYDRYSQELIDAKHNNFPFEVPDFRINGFYSDANQNLWIGSVDQGYTIRYHYKEQFNNDNYLSSFFDRKSVVSMAKDGNQQIWVATLRDGLFLLDGTTHSITPINDLPHNRKGMAWLFIDSQKRIWIAKENNQILRCRYENNRLLTEERYTIPYAMSFAEGSDGTIYISTASPYIFLLRPGEREFRPLQVYHTSYCFIPIILPVNEEQLLISGFGQEMLLINNTTLEISKLPVSTEDYEACIRRSKLIPTVAKMGSRGDLWIGTLANGLLHYDFNTQRLTPIHGVPCNDIGSIEEDRLGNLWVSTMNGLGKYDRTVGQFTNYYAKDGLGGNQFYDRASCLLDDGTLLFGGTHGLTFFNPIDQPEKRPFQLVFQDLKIHNEVIRPAATGSPITHHLSHSPEIVLQHDQNSFSLSFAALDYSEHQRVRYAYQLEGVNKYWIESDNVREAHYANLPAGCYTFHVRALTGDFNHPDAEASIRITVKPAPWLTWWAWCLYLLLAAGVVALFARNIQRIRKGKMMVRKAREEKEQEQRINRMNMSFFANVSHEFRTPLTMISGPVNQLCQSTHIEGNEKRLLLIVQRSVSRMLRLVNQMMDFNKLENDTLRLQVGQIDLIDELRQYIDIFSVNASEKGITLLANGLEEHCTLWIDSDKLDKIVSNLLSNAMKFTPTGGKVELHFDIVTRTAAQSLHPLTPTDHTSRFAKIEVADNGIGIPATDLEKVFERYYQVEKSDGGGNYNWGTGIGLYYARALATLHHGYLWASLPAEGHGTHFTLLLPAEDVYTADEHLPEESSQSRYFPLADARGHLKSERSKANEGERQTLLVVDDDTEVANYLDALLSAHYRIICRFNADSAFRAMQEDAPDLVLSDVVMPLKSGFDLCREIKNDPQLCHIPVILVTAKGTVEDQVKGLEQGADAYVTKPFDPTYLQALIQSQLKNREKLRALLSSSTETDKIAEETLTPQDNAFMTDLYRLMESELSNPELDVARMTELMHTSRTKFYYKVKGLTGQNPGTFFKTYKLNRAAQLLREGKYTISEVADMTGFSTASHFSTSFKKQFGTAPSDYQGS